jgi:biopolymer transport protein ExbD
LDRQKIRPVFDTIVVTVDRDRGLSINGEAVMHEQLGARLFQIYSARVSKNLFVRGAPDLPFGAIVRVIDTAKGSGVGDIGLMSEE